MTTHSRNGLLLSAREYVDPLLLLDSRSKRLDRYSYKLQQAPGQYGLDVVFPNEMEIDESAMSIVIPYADGNRRDGVGDLLEVGGINTERHRSNPIVLFDHGKQVTLPIGLAEDPDTHEYTNYIDPVSRTAQVKAFFYQSNREQLGFDKGRDYEHALFVEQLFDLMCKRYIRAGSIGYQVIHAKHLQPDYERGTPQGLHLLSVLMLEASAVVMPANQDTVRKMLCMPTLCGKPMSPILVKSLSAYAPQKKAVVVSGYKTLPNANEVHKALRQEGIDSLTVTQSIPVPHGDLTETDIPPARWKPGVGAIKDIRRMYRKKSKQPRVSNTTWYKPNETVVAREYLYWRSPYTGNTEMFARTGDKLKIVTTQYDGRDGVYGFITVRRSDGSVADFTSTHLRRTKSMNQKSYPTPHGDPRKQVNDEKAQLKEARGKIDQLYRDKYSGEGDSSDEFNRFWEFATPKEAKEALARVKPLVSGMTRASVSTDGRDLVLTIDRTYHQKSLALGDIRLKYRKTKGLRRRLRKSAAGTSMIYVNNKDLDKVKEEAEKKGIKFDYAGTKNGLDKVRLTGSDESIDEVAKMFGRRLR